MNAKEIEKFINDIKSADIEISLDEIRSDAETTVLVLEDLPYLGAVEINKKKNNMDIYCSFSYNECSYEDRLSSEYFSDIKGEVFTFFKQKELEHNLKQLPFQLYVWDDGCYGCYGTDVYVGFCGVPCSVDIVKQFIKNAKQGAEQQSVLTLTHLLSKKLEDVLQRKGIFKDNVPFQIEVRKDIDYKPFPDNETLFYVGEEYVLFKTLDSHGAISKDHYDLFNNIVDEIEYFTDIYYLMGDKFLQAFSTSFYAQIPLVDFNVVDLEVAFMRLHLDEIKPFLSEKDLQQLLPQVGNINVDDLTDIKQYFLPHIYTEGHTDWKHIKHAISAMHSTYLESIMFEEYQSDENLGDTYLLKMCEVHSKGKNPNVKIMIFDRDNPSILAKIDDEEKGFKEWGNRVYSFALPVPEHRKTTPAVSIEHYYSDNEIMRETDVAGVKRRLYIGNEFDSIGRAPKSGKICKVLNKCGENSIAIIDDNVYDSNSNSTINYALSKSAFAEEIQKYELSHEAKCAFSILFEKILAILEFDKKKRNKNILG